MIAGELAAPPVMQLIDMTRMEADEGRVAVELVPQEFHYNPLGTVHGGVSPPCWTPPPRAPCTPRCRPAVGYTSLDLNVKFLRPVTVASGTLRCEGTVLQRGRRTALAEARLTDSAGRLIAHATSTCLLFRRSPPRLTPPGGRVNARLTPPGRSLSGRRGSASGEAGRPGVPLLLEPGRGPLQVVEVARRAARGPPRRRRSARSTSNTFHWRSTGTSTSSRCWRRS